MRRVHVLHIGKTGGTAMRVALTPYVKRICDLELFLHPHETRLEQVPTSEKAMFILRDPVDRFVSGFNSRRRRGPPHNVEWNRAETVAFANFATPNDLAVTLSAADDREREKAASAMRGIRHVNTFYANWLRSVDYMRARRPDILWVGLTSRLSEDFVGLRRVLGLPADCYLPVDPLVAHRRSDSDPIGLSDTGVSNIAAWYADDYPFLDYFFWVQRSRHRCE